MWRIWNLLKSNDSWYNCQWYVCILWLVAGLKISLINQLIAAECVTFMSINCAITDPDTGLSPVWRQVIIWTNAGWDSLEQISLKFKSKCKNENEFENIDHKCMTVLSPLQCVKSCAGGVSWRTCRPSVSWSCYIWWNTYYLIVALGCNLPMVVFIIVNCFTKHIRQ